MKKQFLTLCAALLLSGCAQEKVNESTLESLVETEGDTASNQTTADSKTETESETISEVISESTTVAVSSEANEETEDKGHVEFSLEGSDYVGEFIELELFAPEGKKIYYTLDGSDPRISESRLEYTDTLRLESLKNKSNVISSVDPALFDTAHCTYDKKEKTLICNLNPPADSAVDKCHVVKAVFENQDGSYSDLYAQTYFIDSISNHIDNLKEACVASGTKLAIVSITCNYDDFFDYDTGIYVKGASFDKSWEEYLASGERVQGDSGRKLLANYSQRGSAWEREVYINILEADNDGAMNVISQNCGIRIQGNYSRSDVQKGFRLYAKKKYGDNRFKYPLFGDTLTDVNGKVIDSFKTFVLRNGGNCAFTAKFNDTFWQSLIGDLNLSTKASRPAVVYLNGEYWGLYVMEEDYSEEYFEDHYDVKSDNVILYKGDAETYESGYKLDLGEVPEGMDEDYYLSDLMTFFKNHKDCKSNDDYNELAALVDVDSLRDYFAVQVWVNNKWDWPGKNWSMWKVIPGEDEEIGEAYSDGKWRFCVYDIEFGGIGGSSEAATNTVKEDNYKPNGLLDFDTKNPVVLCFAYFMTNEGFRNDFYDSLESLSENQFEYNSAKERLDVFSDTYKALLPQFFDRYPNTGDTNNAINGGYASPKCLAQFIKARPAKLEIIINYCEKIENK